MKQLAFADFPPQEYVERYRRLQAVLKRAAWTACC